jgi:hypothetical protein
VSEPNDTQPQPSAAAGGKNADFAATLRAIYELVDPTQLQPDLLDVLDGFSPLEPEDVIDVFYRVRELIEDAFRAAELALEEDQ